METQETDVAVTRDESMDLKSLMGTKEEKKEETSPLDSAIGSKQLGLVVNNKDLKKEEEPLRDYRDTDERRQEFSEKIDEMELKQKQAEAVVVIKKPENQAEDAQMMDEISRVTFDDEGNGIVPQGAKFIRSKNDLPKNAKTTTLSEASNEESSENEENASENIEEMNDATIDVDQEKESIVKILIDKTGLGRNFDLNDDEKKVISESSEVHIVEVEDKELGTMKVSRQTDDTLSFMESVQKYDLSISKTNMIFPLSGFKADMCGLSYGEFSDIALDVREDSNETIDFDKNWKMLTVIYNKMTNISCGKFVDFEDFLKKFAWADTQLAIYGLLISTEPEEDSLRLTCMNKNCNKHFIHKYPIRSLISFDYCTKDYLNAIDKVADVSGQELFKVAEESPVRTIKAIRLPSDYVMEIGPISAYDYLYTMLQKTKEYTKILEAISDNDGESVDGVSFGDIKKKMEYLVMLSIIRGFRVQKNDGSWERITSVDTVIDFMDKYLSPNDFRLINAVYEKAIEDYSVAFSIRDIKCPNCGTVTKFIPVTPQEMVFRHRQRMESTQITLDSLHLL